MDEACRLNPAQTRCSKPPNEFDLDLGWKELTVVLEAIAGPDLDDLDRTRPGLHATWVRHHAASFRTAPITPSRASSTNVSGVIPRRRPKISSLCSPSSGPALLTLPGILDDLAPGTGPVLVVQDATPMHRGDQDLKDLVHRLLADAGREVRTVVLDAGEDGQAHGAQALDVAAEAVDDDAREPSGRRGAHEW